MYVFKKLEWVNLNINLPKKTEQGLKFKNP